MSKTLEEIRAELAVVNSPTEDSIKAPEQVPAAEAMLPVLNVQQLLEQLSKATNIPMERMLGALDAAAPDQPELLPEGAKVYYTSFPNCGVMIQRGPAQTERIEFKGSRMVTTDLEVIAYLDAIADKPGTTIYTKSNDHVTAEVMQVRAEMQANAERAHKRMVAAGERVA